MELAASVPIRVTNADIDGLVITLAAGVRVQGKLIRSEWKQYASTRNRP
jgi:hypothetical protein